jgi:hypothetical protein
MGYLLQLPRLFLGEELDFFLGTWDEKGRGLSLEIGGCVTSITKLCFDSYLPWSPASTAPPTYGAYITLVLTSYSVFLQWILY